MSGWKKLAAASAGGGGLDVDEVFSTYLYDGNSGAQTFVNGLDLSGEGGLVWSKRRNGSTGHVWVDSERNVGSTAKVLNSSSNLYELTEGWSWSFNSDGYSLNTTSAEINDTPSREYCSWSFRKAPKFFDVVTYTGNGASGRAIPHNLGQKPGMFVVKATSKSTNWNVYHRSIGATKHLFLNLTHQQVTATNKWNDTEPTATHFTVDTHGDLNTSGSTYVAYLFAHNDGDGEFGPDGDQDIIKCGSFTTDGSGNTGDIDLGFEPQFIMTKVSSGTTNDWAILDNMRGFINSGGTNDKDAYLFAGRTYAESVGYNDSYNPQPRGFSGHGLATNCTFVYMAIRRGPMAVPESATDVFAIDTGAGSGVPMFGSGFPVDVVMRALPYTSAHDKSMSARLTGIGYGNVEASPWYTDSNMNWDYMDGYFSLGSNQSTWISWMWKRAPGFCDVVSYTGTGATPTVINHNLSVTPEMMWVKSRSSNENWMVYHSALGNTKTLILNSSTSGITAPTWNNTSPNETTFTLGGGGNNGSMNNQYYIAYLFATLPGISKVGSYTGDGTSNSSKVIDCGFTSGARFVIIKAATGEANNWFLFDTERGIVAGNDSRLFVNLSSAAAVNADYIDPHNSGFIVGAASNTVNAVNVSGVTYIFYAVA